jgi:fatty-acyl-CoA synthase
MWANVGDWLSKWATYTPQRVALVDAATGQRTTFGDLSERVLRLAEAMHRRLGINQGDRVAIWSHNCVEYLELFFATAKLGAILVPVNHRLAGGEIAYILSHSGARVLFCGEEFQQAVVPVLSATAIEHLVPLADNAGTASFEGLIADGDAAAVPAVTVGLDDALCIMYTSGTTGRPKGAILTHGSVTWNAVNTQVGWDLTRDDVGLANAPFFHTGGLNVLVTPLLHRGGTVVVMRQWDATEALRLIERERCTVVFGVPTMCQMMLDSPAFATTDLSSLKFIITGGAPCPIPLIEAWAERGIVFKQGYGLTEAGPNCFTLDAADAVRKAGSVGFPNFHVDVRIVDDEGHDVGAGETGELLIAGPHVFGGYWQQPDETAKALVDGWLHTGDLVQRDADGYTTIVDRKKDMIISGGENIYPAEIEKLLHTHPAIREAAIIGVPDSKWGEVGRALIVTTPDAELDEAGVLAYLSGNLARFKLPKSVIFVSELPRNASGKLLKPELRRLFGAVTIER